MKIYSAPWVSSTAVETPLGAALLAESELGAAALVFPSSPLWAGAASLLTTEDSRLASDVRDCLRDPRRPLRAALDFSAAAPLQRAVWACLSQIPLGEVATYGAIAAACGRPGAARAVGSACAANPLLVPCHRTVASGLRLGGFSAGGPIAKLKLLESEQR